MRDRALIIGACNWIYGDEAAGIMIANELSRRLGNRVRVSYEANPTLAALSASHDRPCDLAVFITTAGRGSALPPGGWDRVVLDDPTGDMGSRLEGVRGVDVTALQNVGRHLAALGTTVWIYVLAGRDFNHGAPLSADVRVALEGLENRIQQDIRSELGEEAASGCALLSPAGVD